MVALLVGLGMVTGGVNQAHAQTLTIQVPAGISLLGWCGSPTSTVELIDESPIDTIWLFNNATDGFAFSGDGATPDSGDDQDGGDGQDGGAVDSLDDFRVIDAGTLPAGGGSFTVDVEEGEGSFLAWVQGPRIDDLITIIDVIGPDASSITADLVPDGRQGNGDAAILVLLTDDTPLTPGTYTIDVQADEATTLGAILKRATNGTAQVLNAKFWVAMSSDEVADTASRADTEQIFRDRGNELCGPFNLGIGTIEFFDAPQNIVDQFSDLPLPSSGNHTAHRQLCDAMSQEFGQARSLHFVLVDTVNAPDAQGCVTLGNAAGIPGLTLIAGTRTSCVVVTANAGEITLAGNATMVWHEAGHLLGLNHTSESDGSFNDPIPDTPECAASDDANGDGIVGQFKCPDGGNFMFHDTDNTRLTEEPADGLASHPLFQPAN